MGRRGRVPARLHPRRAARPGRVRGGLRCVAPGGLAKAVKFVAGGPAGLALDLELAAFDRIKTIRHPFLLALERVEVVRGQLTMVMELAEQVLSERLTECRRAGLPGVPRDELIGYLLDAAEALDVIGGRHGLQHLDIKPANLFLVGGHAKVGDFGLVKQFSTDASRGGGFTPRYAARRCWPGTSTRGPTSSAWRSCTRNF